MAYLQDAEYRVGVSPTSLPACVMALRAASTRLSKCKLRRWGTRRWFVSFRGDGAWTLFEGDMRPWTTKSARSRIRVRREVATDILRWIGKNAVKEATRS